MGQPARSKTFWPAAASCVSGGLEFGSGSSEESHIASAYNWSSLNRDNVAGSGKVSKFLPAKRDETTEIQIELHSFGKSRVSHQRHHPAILIQA
jgi:hypothetical protein